MYHDLATKYAPQWNRMWLEQGVTFQMLGRFENASESYLRATECSNSDYTAWVRYAHVHKFRSDVKQDMNTIEEMLRMLPPDDEPVNVDDEVRLQEIVELHFALAKAFTDIDKVKRAAHHYGLGNELW